MRRGVMVDSRRKGHLVRHLVGFPEELSPGVPREVLPLADFVVLEGDDSGFYLYRYSARDEFAGDTWHQTLEEAHEQVEFEFGITESDWFEIPLDVPDSIEFVLARLRAARAGS